MATGARSAKRRVSDPFRFDLAWLSGEAGDEPMGDLRLAGTDEAGRGCLAGPLVTAAVVLDYNSAPFPALAGITDSKLLSSAQPRGPVPVHPSHSRSGILGGPFAVYYRSGGAAPLQLQALCRRARDTG